MWGVLVAGSTGPLSRGLTAKHRRAPLMFSFFKKETAFGSRVTVPAPAPPQQTRQEVTRPPERTVCSWRERLAHGPRHPLPGCWSDAGRHRSFQQSRARSASLIPREIVRAAAACLQPFSQTGLPDEGPRGHRRVLAQPWGAGRVRPGADSSVLVPTPLCARFLFFPWSLASGCGAPASFLQCKNPSPMSVFPPIAPSSPD